LLVSSRFNDPGVLEGLILGALNHLLEQAAWARRQLSGFAGRRARFEMPPWKLAFRVDEQGRLAPADDQAVDVTVVLPAGTPLVALQGMDRAMAAAHVTGNAEFATALSFVLKNLRWDAEEDLSKLVGDIAAHRMVGVSARLTLWQKQAARDFAENVAEYLGEEADLLVRARDLSTFRAELAEFSRRVELLEARVGALR
jgi:ubiquinone biosynthesis protein UbiJ